MEDNKLHYFQCDICGYLYKTEAEELPADFVCPLCGESKEHFTPKTEETKKAE